MAAPFEVYKREDIWFLYRRPLKGLRGRLVGTFHSAGEAIDHAYRNWPWWP